MYIKECIIILKQLATLSRAELSAVYFHTENLLYRGFEIISAKVTRNEKFFVITIKSHNNRRELDRVRNYAFFELTELNDFIKLLNDNGYIFPLEREVEINDI